MCLRPGNAAWLGPPALDVDLWCEVWVYGLDNLHPLLQVDRNSDGFCRDGDFRLVDALLCMVLMNN